jgi:hypothetical protein
LSFSSTFSFTKVSMTSRDPRVGVYLRRARGGPSPHALFLRPPSRPARVFTSRQHNGSMLLRAKRRAAFGVVCAGSGCSSLLAWDRPARTGTSTPRASQSSRTRRYACSTRCSCHFKSSQVQNGETPRSFQFILPCYAQPRFHFPNLDTMTALISQSGLVIQSAALQFSILVTQNFISCS